MHGYNYPYQIPMHPHYMHPPPGSQPGDPFKNDQDKYKNNGKNDQEKMKNSDGYGMPPHYYYPPYGYPPMYDYHHPAGNEKGS